MADREGFRKGVRAHLRGVGRTQQDLARAIGLHPHVLSHKLNGRDGAILTAPDVVAIVTTLAGWGALTTRTEATALLALLSMPRHAISTAAWAAPPLALLDADEPAPALSDTSGDGAEWPVGLHPVPPPAPSTSLVGRVAECAAVCAALATSRLVTLTGVGGTGKTRVALQAASEVSQTFRDGVAFVDLAPLRDPTLLPVALVQALGLSEHSGVAAEEQLLQALRQARLLLVIDNLEHLVEEAPLLARLLATAPFLRILATSRIALRIYGEHEIRVPPLALAGNDPGSSEAVQLFVQRAQAASATFDPQGEALTAVGAICTALDGLPLAIELAAARTKLFPPEALLPLLASRLTVLTGGPRDLPARQQTLRAALDWSYAILPPESQDLYARLGVFAGSFDAGAAAAISEGGSGAEAQGVMLTRLADLADQSLLEVVPGPTPRFRLLETLREYALARLAASGEDQMVRELHAVYFASLAEGALGAGQSPSAEYLERLETERDNLRAAMDWARDDRRVEIGLRLVAAVSDFWWIRGYRIEGQRRAQELVAISGDAEPLLRARALGIAGMMARIRGDLTRAETYLEESLVQAREAGDRGEIANALVQLGNAAAQSGDLPRAQYLFEEHLALARGATNARDLATSHHLLAWIAQQQGRLDDAQAGWEESLSLYREAGDAAHCSLVLNSLAEIAVARGHLDRGKKLLMDALLLGQDVGYALIPCIILDAMAGIAVRENEPVSAARFLGAAEAAREATGGLIGQERRPSVERSVQTGRTEIGAAAWNQAWQEGRAASLEAAIALAAAYAGGEPHGGQELTHTERT